MYSAFGENEFKIQVRNYIANVISVGFSNSNKVKIRID